MPRPVPQLRKNKCLPGLAPYTFNETFNAAQLAPGEEAEWT